MTAPRVTVVMPAFNSERFIEPAIRSVLGQSFRDLELLVLDDASTDGTSKIVEQLAAEDGRIRLIRLDDNIGVAATRNRGLEEAKGEFVALLDSDDLWDEKKLEYQIRLLEDTGADLTACSYRMIDENDRTVCADFIAPKIIDFDATLKKTALSCSTTMLRRTVTDQEKFPVGLYHEDLAYWLSLLQKGRRAVGDERVLASYRLLQGSRASNKLKSAKNRWKIFRGYLHLPFLKSLKAIAGYALNGVKKYKKIS